MAKDYYHDLLLPEVVRYAKIRSMDPENLDEYGAAIFATWYTQNPLGRPDRDNICNFEEPQEPIIYNKKSALEAFGNPRLGDSPLPQPKRRAKKQKGVRFTAHTHPDEPLDPSPDDLLVYDRVDAILARTDTPAGTGSKAEDDLIHFIIDGYTCRKVEKSEK